MVEFQSALMTLMQRNVITCVRTSLESQFFLSFCDEMNSHGWVVLFQLHT
jgi:hypothetical protein